MRTVSFWIQFLSLLLFFSLNVSSQDHFEKHYSNPDGQFSYSICRAGENDFFIGAGNWAETWGLIKMDVHGQIIWAKRLMMESIPYNLEVASVQPEVSTWFSNNDFMDTTIQVSILTETLNVQVSTACVATIQDEIPSVNDQELNIVPNPFHTSAIITIPGSQFGPFDVSIFNSTGALIHTFQNIRTDSFEINRDNLVSGIYFIQVRNKKGIVITGKVIVM
jgi:hypothetical protein